MHNTEVKNDSKDSADDGPSVLGHFSWAVVGRACIPCLHKNDDTRYVSVRIAESEILGHFLHKLNTEVFNCVSVKSFGITEAENKLLNEINSKHCEYAFGKEPFNMNIDFIVKLDDLIEFYNFMDICYNKLLLQNPSNDRSVKCGFVRINDDSVVPYAVKNNQKYVPLFYFEGETESLKTKAINLENWDLAYLKFCCKVQGIKNELFASEKCLVTSLEDVKSFFPEGTKFDDYWPSKIVEMQQPTCRTDLNSNHSWVKTPHVDTSSAVPAQPSSVPSNKTLTSALSKQLHNNSRANTTAVITNLSPNVPVYQNNNWPNTLTTASSNTYQQMSQPQHQPRLVQKLNSAPMHSMDIGAPRTYVNQSSRPQHPPQYYSVTPVNVPNVNGASHQPPPLVRVTASSSLPTAYGNTISTDAYSSRMYQNNGNALMSNSMAVSSRIPQQQQQQQIKSRNTNQAVNSTASRFPPALNPINGPNNVIQAAATSTSINHGMAVNNRQQQQQQQQQHHQQQQQPHHHRTNVIHSGGEIIDLSSPPHSPQHLSSSANRVPSISNNNYNAYKSNSHSNLPPLKRITEVPQLMKNGMPPYKVKNFTLYDKSVPAVNLKVYSEDYAIHLQDIITYYFPRVEMNKLRNVLQNVLSVALYEAKPAQIQVLRDHCKGKHLSEDVPLLLIRDFEANYPRMMYLEPRMVTERDSGAEREAKRQKIS